MFAFVFISLLFRWFSVFKSSVCVCVCLRICYAQTVFIIFVRMLVVIFWYGHATQCDVKVQGLEQ